MAEVSGFDTMFNPKTVAIVGISKQSGSKSERYARGAGFVGFLRKLGFPGHIYPIGPEVEEVLGFKAYPSLTKVPEPVDLAILTISAPNVPAALEDCVAAGVKNVHVYSSGFGETGEEEGMKLEARVVEIAQKGGIRLIGPNCVGLHIPKNKLSFLSFASMGESGEVAFLAQSGGHTVNFVGNAPSFGIRFSKVVNYGNGTILDCTDYIGYLASDPDTKLIALYLEGVRDGSRFLRTVKEVNRYKPVMIWKGGLTGPGTEAAASHTGSLAGNEAIWRAFFKQSGAVEALSLEELLDLTMTFLYLSPPRGRRAGLLIGGGGQSVAAADLFARAGLHVPLLPQEKRQELRKFISPVNTSIRNPVDLGLGGRDLSLYQQTMEIMAAEPCIDFMVIDPNVEILKDVAPGQIDKLADFLCEFVQANPYQKPIAVVLEPWEDNLAFREHSEELRHKLAQAGIVTYFTMSRACRAISKFIGYHELLRESDR